MARRLLSLDADIIGLEAFDDREQSLKDKIHDRLQARSEYDPGTDCVIYTGAWEENGQAKIRVGGRVYCLSRVTAWLYKAGFRLWSLERAVRMCDNPACCNESHVRVVRNQAEAIVEQARKAGSGQLGVYHRLSRAEVALMRKLSAEGVPDPELVKRFGVRLPAVRNVLSGRTWGPKE